MIVTPRNQPPVPIELRPERPARLSMTWLQFFQRCKHSALLHIRYSGGAQSHAMARGSVFHEVAHRAANEVIEHGEHEIPADLAKALLAEVMCDPRFTVPAGEWDYLRQMVYHWARYTVLNPDEILGVEQLLVWDIGDWRISGKVDLAWRNGDTVGVRDYKTARRPLTQDEFNESFQTKLYSLLLAYGKPVTVRDCPCAARDGVPGGNCDYCNGRGVRETVEPYSLGDSAQFFEVQEIYPGIVWDRDEPTERMASRERILTRTDLVEEKTMIESLLAQVSEVFETGQWDAVPGDDQCGKCPAWRECPLPQELRSHAGAVDSAELAEHYAMASFFLEQEKKAVDVALKTWAKDAGPVPLGDGYEYSVAPEKKTSVDREKLGADIAAGIAGPIEDYIKTSYSNRFGRRKAAQGEPEAETNGTVHASGSDREKELDAKYGETLPL